MKKMMLVIFLILTAALLTAGRIEIESTSGLQGISLTGEYESRLEILAGIEGIETLAISSRGENFSQLVSAGFGYAGDTGTPRLPVKRELIAVPLGAEVNITVESYDQEEYSLADLGMDKILPAQPPVAKSADPSQVAFHYNESAYSISKWYGDAIMSCEEIGILRGVRLYSVTYYPVSYNPIEETLRIYTNVHATVNFVGSDHNATRELREKTWSMAYENVYAKTILNYQGISSREDITRYPIKYVIISDDMFEAQLQPFIDWKTRQGYEVITAYTGDIGSSTTSIANYIESLWEEATPADPAPSFILFVGDTDQIPAYSGSQGSHVTDLNYVRLEGGDYMPEIYYGRFSARNTGELQPQIDKTLEYEMFSMPDPSYLDEVVMTAGVDTYHGSQWGNGQINYGTSNYFNAAHGITSHTYLYPASGSSSAQIIQNVSDGVGYINYTAHGSSTSWADPSFTISNINNLQNEHKYPMAVGNCCLTNKFEVGECFGEAWLREEDGGSIGYIGGTNSTYWDEDFWWGVGSGNITSNPTYNGTGPGAYDGMFHDHGEDFANWYTAASSFIMAGNLAVVQGGGSYNYYWEIYSLMGDPSLNPYFGVPAVNTVSHATQLFIGSSQLTVNAEPYSYVGLSFDGDLLAGGLVSETGSITLEFSSLASVGTLDLVVTCQNHEPYIAEVEVVPNEGAFLSINDFSITSDNGDENIDFGETISLSLDLENVGVDAATDVSINMTITDPYITITNGTASYPEIAAGSIETVEGLEFMVAETIPDGHAIAVQFSFTYSEGDNDGSLNFTGHAPLLGLGQVYIVSDDNNNGRLDPGEAAELQLEITNSGSAVVENVLCMVFCESDYIAVSNTWSYIPQIGIGESGTYPFMLTVSENCPVGESIGFDVDITAGTSISFSGSFALNVGLNLEDFESGDLTEWEWETSGDADWFVTSSSPYEGSYCAESGDIGNNEISTLEIELDVLYDDQISFMRKVSSESGWDKLFFYIDGEEMENWSGNQGWEEFVFDISAGTHTVAWVYDKDGSVSSGSDCAWLDYIVFPAIGIPQPPVMTCSITEINDVIELNSILSEDFTIANTGGGTLYYYLSVAETDRSIEGSTFTIDAETYIPGEQVTWNLEVYNNSDDSEWLTDVYLQFPDGVSVISATDFTGGSGDLEYNGATGNGAAVEWNDPNGGWGQIHGQETAAASVTVLIDENQAGNLNLDWTLLGDDYGSIPHETSGTIILETEVLPLEWAVLSQYSGVLNAGDSDNLSITFDSSTLGIGVYTANLIINDSRQTTIIPITLTVGGDIAYGDIDDNGSVEALDASVVLQYAVGIDPAPFAPLPWESWRLLRADVDGNGTAEAYDASLILQYFVGMINQFPVENTRSIQIPQAECYYELVNGELVILTNDDVYSLQLSTIADNRLGNPEFNADDIYTAFNDNNCYQAAMATAEAVSGKLVTIPLSNLQENKDLRLTLGVNGDYNSFVITSEELRDAQLPEITLLSGNYPNPFNPSTTISYQLAQESQVSIDIYNIRGQKIKTLISEDQEAGHYLVEWKGDNEQGKCVPSGIYFYRLTADNQSLTRKMIMLK